jgi:MYXO-CTERM domain-containing protein
MRSGLRVALVLATIAWAAPRAASAGDSHKGPYLQHLGSSAVDVRIELDKAAAVSVEVSRDPPVADAAKGAPVTSPVAPFHSVHLSGLQPSTRYRYDVHVGAATYHGTFVTAPEDSSHAPFTFIAFGDNRSGAEAHARVVSAIAKESYDFLINTGDFVIMGGDEGAWQTFFNIEEPILESHCLFACIGNHELVEDRHAANYERYFGPTEPAAPSAPLYGSFRWGRARFFLLNAFENWSSGAERAWLDDELKRADTEPGIDLRVAVMHHGPYSAGKHGGNKAILAAHVDDLLVAHHVDLVLQGHDHMYERGEAKGLKYILTGGGGAPLYHDFTPVPSTRKAEATYNYVLATVTDDNVAIVSKRPDGSILEECSFARGGSWLCDARPVGAPAAVVAPPASRPLARCGCSVPGVPAGWPFASPVALVLAALLVRRRRG